MKVGYARADADGQTTALQRVALREAGCERVFGDKEAQQRPALARALKAIGKGDVLVVWRLDRLGRSLSDLLRIVEQIAEKGAHLCSLQDDGIDTTKSSGKLAFRIMGSLAEFERSLLAERTKGGIEAARQRGVKIGRKPKITKAKLDRALQLIQAGSKVAEAAKTVGVGRSTLYQAIQEHERRGAA